jgi:hypothetical protein
MQTNSFAIVNSPDSITKPGQFSINTNQHTGLAWLPETSSNSAPLLSVGSGRYGLRINTGVSNIIIAGFAFRNFTGEAVSNVSGPMSNIQVVGNEFSSMALYNRVHALSLNGVNGANVSFNRLSNILFGGGIVVGTLTGQNTVNCNSIDTIGQTGIDVYNSSYTTVTNNTMNHMNGIHGNGLSVYLDNRQVTVANNISVNANQAMAISGYDTTTTILASPAPTSTTFAYTMGSTASGVTATPIAAQTISTITFSGTTATVTTALAHGLSAGTTVAISGATVSSGTNFYNGTFALATASGTTFTYTMSGTPSVNAGGTPSYTVTITYCTTEGLTTADNICLNELTANTNWKGYSTANSNGQLVAGKVRALLCDQFTCHMLSPNTQYNFANASDTNGSVGGSTFTTNANGDGPGNSTAWGTLTFFNVGVTTYVWTGTKFAGNSNYINYMPSVNNNCVSWSVDTTNGNNATKGNANASGTGRWETAFVTDCTETHDLYCFVNP